MLSWTLHSSPGTPVVCPVSPPGRSNFGSVSAVSPVSGRLDTVDALVSAEVSGGVMPVV
jgi:hypothetical protein